MQVYLQSGSLEVEMLGHRVDVFNILINTSTLPSQKEASCTKLASQLQRRVATPGRLSFVLP